MTDRIRAAKTWARIRSEAGPLLLIALLVTAARSSVADHYHVPTGSMEYSLLPGDRVVVDKTAYGVRLPYTKIDLVPRGKPRSGDIVVFDSPKDGKRLIKRVVATAGDFVELKQGRLAINGGSLGKLDEPDVESFHHRLAFLNLADGGGPDIGGFRVPEHMVLVLGDHRGNSMDGRYFGPIEERELYGRAVAIYYRRDEGFTWKQL